MRTQAPGTTIVAMEVENDTMTTERRTLTLEVEPGTEPIVGRVREPDGASREFVGWLGLATVLGRVIGPLPSGPEEAR